MATEADVTTIENLKWQCYIIRNMKYVLQYVFSRKSRAVI